jgi:hypothetical protein
MRHRCVVGVYKTFHWNDHFNGLVSYLWNTLTRLVNMLNYSKFGFSDEGIWVIDQRIWPNSESSCCEETGKCVDSVSLKRQAVDKKAGGAEDTACECHRNRWVIGIVLSCNFDTRFGEWSPVFASARWEMTSSSLQNAQKNMIHY